MSQFPLSEQEKK